MLLFSMRQSSLSLGINRIILWRPQKQMSGIYAARIVAVVTYD
jgi:hypothetical protein